MRILFPDFVFCSEIPYFTLFNPYYIQKFLNFIYLLIFRKKRVFLLNASPKIDAFFLRDRVFLCSLELRPWWRDSSDSENTFGAQSEGFFVENGRSVEPFCDLIRQATWRQVFVDLSTSRIPNSPTLWPSTYYHVIRVQSIGVGVT
jgi:hypothetical protein